MNHNDQQTEFQSTPNNLLGGNECDLKNGPLGAFAAPYKLNIGCGNKRIAGFIGLDMKEGQTVDIACDVRNLSMMPSNCIDEVLSVHCVEHFYVHEIIPTLAEWRRVLKPGGKLVVELPCLDKVLWHFANGSPENFTLWPLYGDPNTHKDGEPALHKWSWSVEQFRKVLKAAGFDDIREETPHYHQPSRDMRFVCRK